MTYNHSAFVSIGSNLGDRVLNCRTAINKISRLHKTLVDLISPYYESEAVGCKDCAGEFINAVVAIKTDFSQHELLTVLTKIEEELGRQRVRPKCTSRTIDLDILFYDDLVTDSPDLVIPHPRLAKRLFVLLPLCDIAPMLIHPAFGVSVSELRNRCEVENPIRIKKWKGK